MPPRQGDGFLAYAFHQTSIPSDDIGVVIHDLGTVVRALDLFRHGKACGVGDPLTQGAGGGLNCIRQEVLRVARGARTHLAEVLQLFDWELRITHQMEQGIDQHGAVAR